MPVIGQETVANNIRKFGGGFKKHVTEVLEGAVDILDERVTENMSLSCHTQEDLAVMGHPYGRLYRPGREPIPHDPIWLVHKQTGTLLDSKRKGVDSVSVINGEMKGRGYVGLDTTRAPYANDIIWGTSVMIPRDFLTGTLEEKPLQNRIREHLIKNLRDMVVNFRGTRTR